MAKSSAKSTKSVAAKKSSSKTSAKNNPISKISELESVISSGLNALGSHCQKLLATLEKTAGQLKSRFDKATKRTQSLKKKAVGKKTGPVAKEAKAAVEKALKEVHVLQSEHNTVKEQIAVIKDSLKKHAALSKHLDQFEKAWSKKVAAQNKKTSARRRPAKAKKAAVVVHNPKAKAANTAKRTSRPSRKAVA